MRAKFITKRGSHRAPPLPSVLEGPGMASGLRLHLTSYSELSGNESIYLRLTDSAQQIEKSKCPRKAPERTSRDFPAICCTHRTQGGVTEPRSCCYAGRARWAWPEVVPPDFHLERGLSRTPQSEKCCVTSAEGGVPDLLSCLGGYPDLELGGHSPTSTPSP